MPTSPLRFEAIEALPPRVADKLPKALQISPSKPIYYKSLILRLLTGTINIECKKTNKVIEQRKNYTTLSYTVNKLAFKKSLVLAIPCDLPTYGDHLKRTLNNNYSLHRDIFFEFCGYFYQSGEGHEIGAFVHLYRVLERIAYCLPLVWAARARDYKGTFKLLKTYFSDPKIGELKILKHFITDFIDDSFRKVQVTLNVHSIHTDWQSRYYKMLFKLLEHSPSLVSSTPNTQITVHFEALLDLMITVRNKYFHALTGDANSYSSEEIVDSNEFFAILNEALANWLSFLIAQIYDYELKRL
jgi:hypothetical protein